MEIMKRLVREEEGQGMVEYGLILGLISIVAIVSIKLIGPIIKGYFDTAAAELAK
jgi:pilus assembly protein Flp/PilA